MTAAVLMTVLNSPKSGEPKGTGTPPDPDIWMLVFILTLIAFGIYLIVVR